MERRRKGSGSAYVLFGVWIEIDRGGRGHDEQPRVGVGVGGREDHALGFAGVLVPATAAGVVPGELNRINVELMSN